MKSLKNVNANVEDYKAYMFGEFDPALLKLFVNFYLAEQIYARHNEDSVKIESINRQKIAQAKAQAKAKASKTR